MITGCDDAPDVHGVQHHGGLSRHHPQAHLPKSRSLPLSRALSFGSSPTPSRSIPDYHRHSDTLDMDLTYITERVIAMTFPMVGMEKAYRDNLREVTRMLKTKHGDKYMVFNLSERRYDIARVNRQVLDFGWPDRLAPPLERLCSICKAMDSWLNSDPQHIAVLHCKGGKERTGIVIEAYRHYSNICASADQALDRFAMKRFYDDKIGSLTQPSQKRYVGYFSGLLSGAIKINSSPLYLHQVVIHGVPNYDGKGGCRAFVKIYQGMQPVHSSGVYNVSSNMQRVVIPLDTPLQLRGDILVKCYHKARPTTREVIFRCQFHTCAISDYSLSFTKDELDDACQDKRFSEDSRVELKFSSGPGHFMTNGNIHNLSVTTDATTDPLVRWDSYENFDTVLEDSPDNLDDINGCSPTGNAHLQGPVDGNLYATVAKKKAAMANGHPPVNGVSPDDMSNGVHTISMDSGISSGHTATPANVMNGTASSSSSPMVRADVHAPPVSDEQSKLDAVLCDMLQDVQSMPDIKPANPASSRPYTVTTTTSTTTRTRAYTIDMPPVQQKLTNGDTSATEDEDNENTPYHACKDSRPFTYLVPTSPSLQRRAMSSNPMRPQSPPLRVPTLPSRSISMEDHRTVSPTPTTPEPRFDGDFYGDLAGTDWLQKQQQKLRDRRDARVHGDRQFREQKLIYELRSAQSRRGPPHSAAETLDDDAYLSDTLASLEVFGSSREPSSESSVFSTPLHVHTYNGSGPSYTSGKPPIGRGSSAPSSPLIPSRSSSREVRMRYAAWPAQAAAPTTPSSVSSSSTIPQSRPLQRQRSDTSHDRERPFVVVKRAHEQARNQAEPGYPSYSQTYAYTQYQQQPQPLATSSPAPRPSSPTSGLLTTVTTTKTTDIPSISPVPSRLDELEMSLQAVSSPQADRTRSPEHKPQSGRMTVDGPPGAWEESGKLTPSLQDDRPATPGFPVQPRTPYANREPSPGPGSGLPPKSPTSTRKDRSPSPSAVQQLRAGLIAHGSDSQPHSATGQSSPSVYFGQSRHSSMSSLNEPSEVITHTPVFMKDTSKYWYKPNISREDAINMLKDKQPGTFVVRDSNSFPGAYGLALKVATPPPNVQNKSGDLSNELVRHFLIEPTTRGVRLKGCANEPVFGSLSALVYQHSITPLALPCKLLLPESDPANSRVVDAVSTPSSAAQLLAQGAACNVLYLYSVDTELLTGPEAVRKAAGTMLNEKPLPTPTVVHFKVSSQGITITDSNRKLFFRRHYPVNAISHCGLDPGDRRWTQYQEETGTVISTHRIFGYVSAKPANPTDNQCHLFAELEPEQPAFAIVNFVTKVMMSAGGGGGGSSSVNGSRAPGTP